MVVIINFLHYSLSRPSILFLGLFLLTPLLASSHIFPKGCSYLVSYLGGISGCAGMVQSAGSPMSTAVALWFRILVFFLVLFSLWLVYLFWYGLVVPAVAWKAPKLCLVLELGSEIMWGWFWWGFPLPPVFHGCTASTRMCILSWILGHLCVVVVGIEYY